LVLEALQAHGVEGEVVLLEDGDLAIVDLNLPKRSGLEVLQAMSKSVKCGRTTAIIPSSSDAQRDRTESISLGAVFKATLEGSENRNGR
jgi:DNA-binding response OmpR family regulator